jgi:two-component system sensor histidine kinase CpxA
MKPGKLYVKISLSFLGLFFITWVTVLTLFAFVHGKQFLAQTEEDTETKVLIVKEIVEQRLRSVPAVSIAQDDMFREILFDYSKILEAKIWLQQPDGTIPVRSFTGEIPERAERIKKYWRTKDYSTFSLYRQGRSGFYAIVPIVVNGEDAGQLNILFDRGPPNALKGFTIGLLMISLGITPLIIPISRFVVKPLKQLSKSALRIADGDLSHRADVAGKDEITRLCQSFNYMADKLERMIISGKELSANVSHELRTPLTRIRVAEEMLREKLEQEELAGGQRYLDEMREDISELETLIARILELSKLDIQETPLSVTPMDPSAMIRDLLAKLEPVMEQKQLRVATDLSYASPFIGDREALGTALMNVLGNAVKFAPEKGKITIRMASEHGFLTISVANTYKEIPEEELSKIFDPFHRIKKTKAAGSGLGLAITKKIIERHGGTIEARNADQGFEIVIALPSEKKS